MNWNSLTTPEIWAALKTAPKIAGPWQGSIAGWQYRCDPHDAYVVSAEYGGLNIRPAGTWIPGLDQKARDKADAILREAGWLLVEPNEL